MPEKTYFFCAIFISATVISKKGVLAERTLNLVDPTESLVVFDSDVTFPDSTIPPEELAVELRTEESDRSDEVTTLGNLEFSSGIIDGLTSFPTEKFLSDDELIKAASYEIDSKETLESDDYGKSGYEKKSQRGMEARRIDSNSQEQRLIRPSIKVQNRKYQTIKVTSSEEEEDSEILASDSISTNMRVAGISKDSLENNIEKTPSVIAPIVHEKILQYKAKPMKKHDSRYEKIKIPYSKPIKITMTEEVDENIDFFPLPYPQNMNMRIIGVPKEETISETPDLQVSETTHTKSHLTSLVLSNINNAFISSTEKPEGISTIDHLSTAGIPFSKEESSNEAIISIDYDNDKFPSSVVEDDILEGSGDNEEGNILPQLNFIESEKLNSDLNAGANMTTESSITGQKITGLYARLIPTRQSTSNSSFTTTPKTTRMTFRRPIFSRRPYPKSTLKVISTTQRISSESSSRFRRPIKRFSNSPLTRTGTLNRRTSILNLSSSSQNLNDILPLESFWDEDSIQKWKNIPQVYTDYGKQELNLSVLKDTKRLRHSVGDILQDFSNISYPINKERICRVRKVQIIFIIFSRAGNFHQRNMIRKTWLNQVNVNEADEIKHIFLLPQDNNLLERVTQEQKEFNDIVYANVHNADLAIAFLKWVADYCPRSQFVMKLDDDVYVNLEKLLNTMKRITEFNGIYGIRATHLVTERGDEGLSMQSWPWKTLPPYLDSSILLMGGEIVRKLYGAAQSLPKLNHEGIYLTSLCTQSAGVKRYLLKRFFGEKRDFNLTNCASEYLDAFRVTEPSRFEMVTAEIKRLKSEDQKCFGSIDCVESVHGICLGLHEVI